MRLLWGALFAMGQSKLRALLLIMKPVRVVQVGGRTKAGKQQSAVRRCFGKGFAGMKTLVLQSFADGVDARQAMGAKTQPEAT